MTKIYTQAEINGSKPANPSQKVRSVGDLMHIDVESEGLTKREMFAMAALQGMLSSGNYIPGMVAVESVRIADELLTRLEQ